MSAALVDDRSLAVRIWGAIDSCEQMRAAGRLRRRKEPDGTILYVHVETNRSRDSWQTMWRQLQSKGWCGVKVGEDWLAWEHYCPDCGPDDEDQP